MSNVLTTRDGFIGNSPRYTGGISPPYRRILQDDTGAAINLTNISTANFAVLFVNQSNPSNVFTGTGTWTILNATQGEVSYQYGIGDLQAGNWYLYVTVQLIGEAAPRVFDPDLLCVNIFPTSSGGESVTITSVNISEINGNTFTGSTLPVEDVELAGYIAATSPPSMTNAGSDTSYTFSSQVNRIIIANNTSANVNYAFDTVASAGSLVLVPGAMLVYPKKCTVLHLYTAATQTINGTSPGNIVVLGAL